MYSAHVLHSVLTVMSDYQLKINVTIFPDFNPPSNIMRTPAFESYIEKELATRQLGFEVLATASKKMTVFWGLAPCSLVENFPGLFVRSRDQTQNFNSAFRQC
jgi:hypothetical protein